MSRDGVVMEWSGVEYLNSGEESDGRRDVREESDGVGGEGEDLRGGLWVDERSRDVDELDSEASNVWNDVRLVGSQWTSWWIESSALMKPMRK